MRPIVGKMWAIRGHDPPGVGRGFHQTARPKPFRPPVPPECLRPLCPQGLKELHGPFCAGVGQSAGSSHHDFVSTIARPSPQIGWSDMIVRNDNSDWPSAG